MYRHAEQVQVQVQFNYTRGCRGQAAAGHGAAFCSGIGRPLRKRVGSGYKLASRSQHTGQTYACPRLTALFVWTTAQRP